MPWSAPWRTWLVWLTWPSLDPVSDAEWEVLAAVLAEMPALVARLRAEHGPDAAGYCRSCTTGGTGTRAERYPCSVARLADRAAGMTPEV